MQYLKYPEATLYPERPVFARPAFCRGLYARILLPCIAASSLYSATLISEDFSSGASDFSAISGGTWAASSGRYVLSSPATGSASGVLGNISVHDTSVPGDFELSAMLNITGTGSAWNDAVIVFGYQDANNYYYVSLNESNDGNTKGILKVVNGSPTQLADITISVASDTDYPVEILRSGASIVVSVNASQVASASDSTFTSGKVGFGSFNDGAEFDDLIVDVDAGGAELFSDGFDDGNANGWTVSGGSWSVDTNEYYNSGDGWSYTGNTSWDDYSVQADVKAEASTWAVIHGRFQDLNNSYFVEIHVGNQEVALWRRVSGTWTKLDSYSMTISLNTWYELKLEMDGSALTGYIDGVARVSATDSSLTSGQIALRSGNDARFDNVVVNEIGGFVDTQAPSVPTGLATSNITTTTVDLDWNASTDNVGVAGYNLYEGSNYVLDVGNFTSLIVEQLTPNTSYTFSLSAYDAASNESDPSSGVNVTTAMEQVAAPQYAPGGGTYTSAQSVTLTSSTSGASIRYTTDGSTPTSGGGTVYSGPVSIGTTGTLKAIAYKSGMSDSSVTSVTYTINIPGTALDATDGFYNDALSSSQTGTFTAEFSATPDTLPMDVAMGLSPDSADWYDDFAVIVRFNPSGNIDARNGGSYSADSTIAYSANTTYHFRLEVDIANHIYSAYVTPNGGSEVTIGSGYAFRSDQSSATHLDYQSAVVVPGTSGEVILGEVAISGSTPQQAAAPQFSPGGGTYSSTQNVSITTSTSGATIRYTTDGSTPTSTSGTVYSGPVSVSSTATLKAIAYKSAMTDSSVVSASYTINGGGASLVVPQSIVDAAASAPQIRYNRYLAGGAHTWGDKNGGWQTTHALAVVGGNTGAEAKMLQQIQYSLQGANCISANGGYPAQHERHITGAYTILKDSDFWNNTLTASERNKITLLMKATLVSCAYTTADKTYQGTVTALDGDTNLNRGFNPNFREGMFGGLIHAMVFFGGVSAVENILDNYDHDAFLAELQAAGLSNTAETFNWAVAHPGDGAPSGSQIETNIHTYRAYGDPMKGPMEQLYEQTMNTYSGNVNCGLNGGAGILWQGVPTGTIVSGCGQIPNSGQLGMLKEFNTTDGNGPRSSMSYAYGGFRPNLTSHAVVLNGGYWQSGTQADAILARLDVGITDLQYKLQQGYRSYHKGVGYPNPINLSTADWSWSFAVTLPLWFDVLKVYHDL